MKRTALALTFILALLISAIAGIVSSKATSTYAESAVPLTISILSPANDSNFGAGWANGTSYVEEVTFPLIYETNEVPSWVGYSINGNSNVTVSENSTIAEQTTALTQGIFPHQNTLTLYANDTLGNWATPQTVTYFIDTPPHPTSVPTQVPTATPISSFPTATPISSFPTATPISSFPTATPTPSPISSFTSSPTSSSSPTSTTTQSTPSPMPTVPEFSTGIILPLFAVIILLSTVFIRKRIPKK
jgi:hypothetical protein